MDDGVRAKIRRSLIARRAEQFRLLEQLVKIPSENPPGDCAPHAEQAAAALEKLGFQVERHPVPAALCEERGMVSATNLVVRHVFGDGPTVALSARGDTPPAGMGWTADPYGGEIRQGVMFGRGVVTKANIVAYAYALRALVEVGEKLRGSVELHVSYDGEIGGSLGPKWLLDNRVSKPDFVIAAGSTYQIVTHAPGSLMLSVELSARAAEAPGAADVIGAATKILSALYAHQKNLENVRPAVAGLPSPGLVVGRIAAGERPDRPPASAVIELTRSLNPNEVPERIQRAISVLITKATVGLKGIQCRVQPILIDPPLNPLAGTKTLADAIERHASALVGEKMGPRGTAFPTGARHYAAAGIPTLCYGAGPKGLVGDAVTGPDERLALDDLRKATEVVAMAVGEVVGTT